jgi:hypothetical protein
LAYDRFVRDQGFGALNEIAQQVWEPTADARRRPVGDSRQVEGR